MTDIIQSVTGVFSAVGDWFMGVIPDVINLFYVPESGLTFLGVTTLVSTGIALILLFIRLIGDFVGLGR